jgi:hypothetical protein
VSAEPCPVEVYQFHVLRLEISPAIWRRVLVRSNSNVADLHFILQIVMGWEDLHLHRFVVHGKDYGIAKIGGLGFADDPRKVALRNLRLRVKERFLYEYDFGDFWQHQIRLERILPFSSTRSYPVCLTGARRAPPEDCGGPRAFMDLRAKYNLWHIENRLLEILEDIQEHMQADLQEYAADIADYGAEARQFHYWLTEHQFDRKSVNQRLQQYAAGADIWSWPA